MKIFMRRYCLLIMKTKRIHVKNTFRDSYTVEKFQLPLTACIWFGLTPSPKSPLATSDTLRPLYEIAPR